MPTIYPNDPRITPAIEPRFTPVTDHAPFRVKVSADFGPVNTDINSAVAAGATLYGILRPAADIPARGGLLLNVNLPPSEGELYVVCNWASGSARYRPLAVHASGGVGYVLVPHGYGHPTGFFSWSAAWEAKNAAASVVVTSQPFAW